MKITSNKYAGRSLVFFDKEISFDSKGEANVSSELGEKINAEYGDMLNVKVATKEETKEKIDSAHDGELKKLVIKLQSEKEILNQRVEALTETVDTAKVETQNWKDEFEKISSGNNPTPTFSVKTTKQDIALIIELTKKSKVDLEEMAVALALPKEDWEELKKEDLTVYLATQAIDANA